MASRLAFIEAALKIIGDQHPLWNAFEAAARDAMGTMRAMHDRIQAMESPPPLPERLAVMEEVMASHLSALQSVRDEATAPYKALSPAQKETADSIMGMGMM